LIKKSKGFNASFNAIKTKQNKAENNEAENETVANKYSKSI